MVGFDDTMLTNSKLKIRDEFLKILQDDAFNGMNEEDVVDHIAKVLKITERIKMTNIEKNALDCTSSQNHLVEMPKNGGIKRSRGLPLIGMKCVISSLMNITPYPVPAIDYIRRIQGFGIRLLKESLVKTKQKGVILERISLPSSRRASKSSSKISSMTLILKHVSSFECECLSPNRCERSFVQFQLRGLRVSRDNFAYKEYGMRLMLAPRSAKALQEKALLKLHGIRKLPGASIQAIILSVSKLVLPSAAKATIFSREDLSKIPPAAAFRTSWVISLRPWDRISSRSRSKRDEGKNRLMKAVQSSFHVSIVPSLSSSNQVFASLEFVNVFVRIGFNSAIDLVSFDKSQVVTINRKFICGFRNGDCKTGNWSENTVDNPHGFVIHGIEILKGNKKVTKEALKDDGELWAITQNLKDGKQDEFLSDEHGVLWCGDRLCVLDDTNIREALQSEVHSSLVFIHLGSTKMYRDLKQNFWWNGMKNDVVKFVVKCLTFQKENITMDLVNGLPKTLRKNDSISIVVDQLTKSAYFLAIREGYSSKLAEIFQKEVVKLHGTPVSIVLDRDPRFTSQFWNGFQKAWGTKLNNSTAFHPQTDGQSERTIQTLADMLRCCALEWTGNWDDYLCLVEFTYNNSWHASIGMAHYEMLYGRKCRSLICWNEEKLKEDRSRQNSYAGKHRRILDFKHGDHFFLKVSPWKGYNYHPLHVVEYPFNKIQEDLSCKEEAEAILAHEERIMQRKTILFVKVLWKNHFEREAT
nr:DNA/RNA polymerases superfamily protein [Tanacetum cinerariifolium]